MWEKYITQIFDSKLEMETFLKKEFGVSQLTLDLNVNYQTFLAEKTPNDTFVWFDYNYPMASRKGLGILRNGRIVEHYIMIMS